MGSARREIRGALALAGAARPKSNSHLAMRDFGSDFSVAEQVTALADGQYEHALYFSIHGRCLLCLVILHASEFFRLSLHGLGAKAGCSGAPRQSVHGGGRSCMGLA